jgi:hypothetical protein
MGTIGKQSWQKDQQFIFLKRIEKNKNKNL